MYLIVANHETFLPSKLLQTTVFVNTTFSHTLNTDYNFTFYHVNIILLYLAYLL